MRVNACMALLLTIPISAMLQAALKRLLFHESLSAPNIRKLRVNPLNTAGARGWLGQSALSLTVGFWRACCFDKPLLVSQFSSVSRGIPSQP